jgi:hypothetical protein
VRSQRPSKFAMDEAHPNSRFPSQEIVGNSKIPTIIYYDQDGNVRAVGAEATREGLLEMAEDENWTKAEWFAPSLSIEEELM